MHLSLLGPENLRALEKVAEETFEKAHNSMSLYESPAVAIMVLPVGGKDTFWFWPVYEALAVEEGLYLIFATFKDSRQEYEAMLLSRVPELDGEVAKRCATDPWSFNLAA